MTESLTERQHAVKSLERTTRTPTADAFSGLSYQVLKLANLLTEIGDGFSQPAGQTSARWQILAAIEREALSVAQIARALGLARQSVQRIADLLVQGHYASFQENPAHRRAKLLALTDTGRASLQQIQAQQAVWANQVSASFDEQQLRQACALLTRMQQELVHWQEEAPA